ncbi:hypothetical protein [Henriciella aquimarina]|uniref:hypothetical protein n=1 Tax=Henriciella aquimarina TaxID=545261 RepID=UPI0009FBEFBA|nr:hypothetical protein [Henriciella aquimarina]
MDDKDTNTDKSALEALDRFLEELRREFASNPAFAHRAVRALGANVVFDAGQAADLLNPVELVDSQSEEDARRTLQALSVPDLKKVAKSSRLATPTDLSRKSKDDIVALILKRAKLRLESRRSGA